MIESLQNLIWKRWNIIVSSERSSLFISSNLPDPRQPIPNVTLGFSFLGHPTPPVLSAWSPTLQGECYWRVSPFRVSIFRDRRPVLYAEVVPSGYYVPIDHAASTLVLLNPALFCELADVGRFCLTTLHPYLHSSLTIVTRSTRSPRSARGLSPFYPASDN